ISLLHWAAVPDATSFAVIARRSLNSQFYLSTSPCMRALVWKQSQISYPNQLMPCSSMAIIQKALCGRTYKHGCHELNRAAGYAGMISMSQAWPRPGKVLSPMLKLEGDAG